MILRDIGDYLAEHDAVPLPVLAHRFGVDTEVLRGMLDLWVRKGKVRQSVSDSACGGCAGCGDGTVEVYEWTGDRPPTGRA